MERMACGFVDLKFDASQADVMSFSGYGAVFGNVDSYGDVIAPGAFADTLAASQKSGVWPAMLSQHGGFGMSADDMTPVGVWTELSEDGHGLKVAGKFAETPRGRELYTLMKMEPRPAINGLSIGYIPKEWTSRSRPDEPRRTLKKIELVEISPVTFPANGKARVTQVKGTDMTERDFEKLLTQDLGFSRSEARVILNKGFKALADDDTSPGLAELAEALKRRNEIFSQ